MEGKFPLTDYIDLYEHSKKIHKLNDIEIELEGADGYCYSGKVGKLGTCNIVVKKHITTVGGKRKKRKSKTMRRKRNSRRRTS